VTPLLARSRPVRTAALVAATITIIGACGGDDTADDAAPTTTPVAAASSAPAATGVVAAGASVPIEEGAYPVTIEHHLGTTTVDAEPQRVVTLGLNDQDFVLAFGVQPVAAAYWNGAEEDVTQVWTDAAVTAEPAVLDMPDGLNIEAVAATQPDLIIAMFLDVDATRYAQLSAIAPTIVRSADYADYGVPWQDTTRVVGAALGRPQRAAQLVEAVEAKFNAAAAAHPEWAGTTFSLLDYYADQIGVYRSDEPRPAFFRALGFEVPAAVDELAGADTWGQVSLEAAEAFDLDLVIWRVGSPEQVAEIEAEPVISSLDVMQRGDVVWMDLSTDAGYAFGWNTVLSLPFALDGIVPVLEELIPAA
jgi:iron-siderophore transport system substrate-binding protein